MKIIPVIDVKAGQVVMANGKNRADYPLLRSIITPHTTPTKVVADLLDFHDFDTLYIADLDSIMGNQFNWHFYQDLAACFPQLTIWLDAGLKSTDLLAKAAPRKNVQWVAASETCAYNGMPERQHPWVLSLDFKGDQLLGDAHWLDCVENWPQSIIVMDLDRVGKQQGPGMSRLKTLMAGRVEQNWIASGGVRHVQDLHTLHLSGVKAVLLASALHHGVLNKQHLLASESWT
ncbi:HisA/HisF family protein, putative [Methylophaga frappieri]|uniref:HisA/HisF family protein, putative n=1 Tax=Methylophaga frappieri (strain ATCC BAA-2434 / DSM 25690 / JAM7) TaxID=754477 RepID=I1YJ24_METFJ|nr:HisA/HisF-related TIM barrel protein [Methylophaga frappieri]AFJ02917.1 HisA/HisF family protein, putative [Methylophaga frappieri]